nr:unnamed protein product [Callosobruchus analis]
MGACKQVFSLVIGNVQTWQLFLRRGNLMTCQSHTGRYAFWMQPESYWSK